MIEQWLSTECYKKFCVLCYLSDDVTAGLITWVHRIGGSVDDNWSRGTIKHYHWFFAWARSSTLRWQLYLASNSLLWRQLSIALWLVSHQCLLFVVEKFTKYSKDLCWSASSTCMAAENSVFILTCNYGCLARLTHLARQCSVLKFRIKVN